MDDTVMCADALDTLRSLPDAVARLVYLDPPFGTGSAQRLERMRTGTGERTRTGFGGREYRYETTGSMSYEDARSGPSYAAWLRPHLEEVHRVLGEDGSLYLHLDYRSVHYARVLLDEIFGEDRLVNEIIWAYDYGGRPRDRFPRKHDNILWYAKGRSWVFNAEDVDRIPYMAPGLVGAEKAARGKLPTDVWWMTIVPTNSRERTGYPTQKPERLLERIILASSDPGDLVVDVFCGSGTTGVAAKRHGRRVLLADNNPEAVGIARARLASTEGEPR